MKRITLTKEEKAVENRVEHFVPVGPREFKEIAQAIAVRKKDAVLNIRVNSHDLEGIKHKAKRLGLKYQTLVSEVLHRVAEA